jgi:hypothetical protein
LAELAGPVTSVSAIADHGGEARGRHCASVAGAPEVASPRARPLCRATH